jgi:patatin-like phospholipase/acyl hydrolase
MSNTVTQRLRNYHSSAEEYIECTSWQAARATSAAPTFFDPIELPNGVTFRDGALRDNNPILELTNEINLEFPQREVSTIVSLGTGVSSSIKLGKGLISVAMACSKIATHTEKRTQDFVETYCKVGGYIAESMTDLM